MKFIQLFRFISIAGAFLVGYWLPVRLIGYQPDFIQEMAFDLIVTIVAGINIYIYFNRPYFDSKKIKSYLNLGFLLDVISIVPLTFLAQINVIENHEWFLFFNLPIVRHIRHIKSFLDEFPSLNPISYRLIPIFLSLPLLVHLLACGWIFLGGGTVGNDPDPVFNYIRSVYWAFTTLTTVGYGDISAKTGAQMLFACSVQVVGVAVFGFILSNVASLLSRVDAAREHHMDSLDKIETFMTTYRIPDSIRSETREYYHYLWKSKKGYQDHSLISELPSKLQSQLLLHINKTIIEKVPFLKAATQDMIVDLVHKLESRIFVPGEKIFKAGEPGDALYFIHSGEVDIVGTDNKVLARLKDGAFFGEMALINDQPRSATVVAVKYCDAYLLRKKVFIDVMQSYPEFRHHIEATMLQRKGA